MFPALEVYKFMIFRALYTRNTHKKVRVSFNRLQKYYFIMINQSKSCKNPFKIYTFAKN